MRIRAIMIVAVLATLASPAEATAGFAEWTITTPGGHLIASIDGFKEEHGVCLRSSAAPDDVVVARLMRWRYHPGQVIGESERGFFLFDEARGQVTFFDSEREMQREVAGAPISSWRTPTDGWQEDWFPFFVWQPCRALLAGEPAPYTDPALTVERCGELLSPDAFAHHRRTTWGRRCADPRMRRAGDEAPEPIVAFCEALER